MATLPAAATRSMLLAEVPVCRLVGSNGREQRMRANPPPSSKI